MMLLQLSLVIQIIKEAKKFVLLGHISCLSSIISNCQDPVKLSQL